MKYNCLDQAGDLVAIVDADSAEEALKKGKDLNPTTASVEERGENAHERR